MRFSKEHIISEIKRTAEQNGGEPLGTRRFMKETGICQSDWYGKFWPRWGDAIVEAGYKPNELRSSYADEKVIGHLVSLIKELGHYPVSGELRMKTKTEKGFPSHHVFLRVGRKAKLAAKVVEYCQKRSGYDDVIRICEPIAATFEAKGLASAGVLKEEVLGYVYMTKVTLKSATSYKIGYSTSPYKRVSQLNTRSPVEEVLVHEIETNDPPRSEQYWHKKYSDKREPRTEYFNLRSADIQLFKKYKSMMWQLIFTPPN